MPLAKSVIYHILVMGLLTNIHRGHYQCLELIYDMSLKRIYSIKYFQGQQNIGGHYKVQ